MSDLDLNNYYEIVRQSPIFQDYYEEWEDWREAPPMGKTQLRKLLATNFSLSSETRGVYLVRSGGSTRKPLVFPVDIQENLAQRDLLARELVKAEIIREGTIALNLFSYTEMYRTAAILDDILERCGATTLAMSAAAPYESMLANAQHFKPHFLLGTPSKLSLFANFLREKGIRLTIPNILFAGEFLLPSQAQLLKETFGLKNIYSLYGSAETGIWAWSHYSRNSSSFRFLSEIHLEIVQPDPEGFGEILVTNLIRKRFPLFRYKMGDRGKIERGGAYPTLILRSRNRKSFSLNADSFFLDDFDELFRELDAFQIQLFQVSEVRTELKFLLVKENCSEEAGEKILKKARKIIESIIEMNPKFNDLKIQLVSRSALHVNPSTSKTPSIVDFRN